ncbi:hypothetical protein KP509_34G046100 [Ceratopteris richardii]|uniref:STICHEL DnaA-N-like alpha-beta domain-containing protein n=1 Tax=Ceratopteris richardii TaxID=49495 RepID=A0A8T2QJF7_CERRI|nr:hypothetical protein KP509_34G046100 [Ceratopteris richardii]
MMEDDEPGELPLIRSFHVLKQSKDSSAMKARPNRMVPAIENACESDFKSLEATHDDWRSGTQDHVDMEPSYVEVVCPGQVRKHGHSRITGHLSHHMAGRDVRHQSSYEEVMHPMQSLDSRRGGTKKADGGTSEWHRSQDLRTRDDDVLYDIHRGGSSASHDRTTEWVRSSANQEYSPASVNSYHVRSFAKHEADQDKLQSVQNTAKREKEHKLWTPSNLMLSPFALDLNNDTYRSPHSYSLSLLEEPVEEREEHPFQHGGHPIIVPQRLGTSEARTHRPFSIHDLHHTHRKRTMGRPDVSSSPLIVGTKQTNSDHTRAALSDSEFYEYEVEGIELPIKKDSGRAHVLKSKDVKYNKVHGARKQNIETSMGIRSRVDKIPSSELGQWISTNQISNKPEAGTLPLLAESEDYNGSEDYRSTSLDGDIHRLSMTDLHGELELLECSNAVGPDKNNSGTVVQKTDVECLELFVPEKCKELAVYAEKPRNLCQKYRPKAFEEVVGQHVVSQALSNAILKSKIAPVYLFQGSRGTGKTSAARIFAAALICNSPLEQRPCGLCTECMNVARGKCKEVKEVDAASNNGVERVKALFEQTISEPPVSRYKVFIVDECHVLTTETWNCLLKILEEPPMNVVFVLITTDADQLPRTVVSRCQKFLFPKIRDTEIVRRLEKLAILEGLTIDADTLQLIASRSEGSLRDAETILDQVSLLGQQVNSATVYQLVGSVSDGRVLGLLNSALMADTVSTVQRVRELVDSGVEPLSLMSRLAALITDILAGTFNIPDDQRTGFFRKEKLSEMKLERLRLAMKTLFEAEKQLRTSNERTIWLIAALLQLGPERTLTSPCMHIGSSVSQSPIALDDNETDFDHRSSGRQTWPDAEGTTQNLCSHPFNVENRNVHGCGVYTSSPPFTQDRKSSNVIDDKTHSSNEQSLNDSKLDDVWCKVLERCQSNTLRQLLYSSVRLTSILISEVETVVCLEICNPDDNASCGRSQKRIADLFEAVLGFPVEIKMSLASLPPGPALVRPQVNYLGTSNSGSQTRTLGAHVKRPQQEGQGTEMESEIQKNTTLSEAISGTQHGEQPNDYSYSNPLTSTVQSTRSSQAKGSRSQKTSVESSAFQQLQDFRMSAGTNSAVAAATKDRQGNSDKVVVHANNLNGDMKTFHDDLEEELSDEERGELGETKLLSPEFNGPDDDLQHARWRGRHSTYEGPVVVPVHNIEGRRSSDADVQRRQGKPFNMVQRLSMRSRIRSLPSSDPNSPDRVPNSSHVKAHEKEKVSKSTVEGVPHSPEGAGESSTGRTAHKKGIVKGGFARFFHGRS